MITWDVFPCVYCLIDFFVVVRNVFLYQNSTFVSLDETGTYNRPINFSMRKGLLRKFVSFLFLILIGQK